MKIVRKLPNSHPDVDLKLIRDNWRPLKEPNSLLSAIIFSIPLMIIGTLITIGIIFIFSTISLKEIGITSDGIVISINLTIILWIFLLLVLHEFIHLILVPNFVKSKKTYVGITFYGGFVFSEEEISKTRFIIITVAPYIIISIVLPLLLGVFGLLTTTLKLLILLNSMASSVDLLTLFLVISQVPKNATLISNGPKTYWKIK